MKVGANELFEVVRQVVREEVKKVLPGMVAKHLSEAYIRKAIAESTQVEEPRRAQPRRQAAPSRLPTNLREIIAGTDPDDEVTPEALPNDTHGIYEPANPLVKKSQNNEAIAKLLNRDNPMASIYEGISPIDQDAAPVERLPEMDFSKMNALMDGMERVAKKGSPSQLSEDAQLKELERKRKMLEIPVQARPKVM